MIAPIFQFLSDSKLLAEIDKCGQLLHFQAGDIIIPLEKYIKVIPLLISGTIKVLRVDTNGNELLLYYLAAGQSCAVSLSTCLTHKLSHIKAVAEEATTLVSISVTDATKWFDTYPSWRTFVLKTMDNRFEELLQTVDSIAFSKTDERLVHFLIAKSKVLQTNTIHITHQEIATELATSREVISRLLKHLEQSGKLKLFRNRIELLVLV